MNHYDFLKRLFENKPDNARILIHQLPLQRSNFFEDHKSAADFVDSITNGPQNIYTTGGLLRAGITTGRGKKQDIIGTVAIHIDIDLKKDDKPRGVETLDEAINLIMGHGIDPTLIISTGNGIHAWWIFSEPYMFTTDNLRDKIEGLCQRLQETIRQRAKKKDWDIDSTHDVTRVLRIPGTYNRKDPANPSEVKLLIDTGIEYSDPDTDFEDFIVGEDQITVRKNLGGIVHVSSSLVLDPNAIPPADRFQDLNEIDPKFGQTFKGQRGTEDTKKWKDTSASSYSQSLANYMAQGGWSDQEIADTIIAFYRENQNNPNIEGKPSLQKALRPDYIERTIGLARASVANMKVEEYLQNVAPLIGTEFEKKLDPDGQEGRDNVNRAFGGQLRVVSIIEHMGEDTAKYVMMVQVLKVDKNKKTFWKDVEISFKSTKIFLNLIPFRERIFEKTQIALRISDKYWKGVICPNWKKFMDVNPVGEQTIRGRMKYWIECYLEGKPPQTREEAAEDDSPFVFKGQWHIPRDPFNHWCKTTGKDNFDVVDSEKDFSAVGAPVVRYDVKSQYSGDRKTLRPWKIPASLVPPPLMPVKTKGKTNAKSKFSNTGKSATGN